MLNLDLSSDLVRTYVPSRRFWLVAALAGRRQIVGRPGILFQGRQSELPWNEKTKKERCFWKKK